MKRIKLLIIIFCLAISIPLIYLILRTYQSLEQEELAELRYFAETIFDEMEEDLGSVVMREEGRDIDEYNYNHILGGQAPGHAGKSREETVHLPVGLERSDTFSSVGLQRATIVVQADSRG